MRILVCGDRNWMDYKKILDTLREYDAFNIQDLPIVIDGEAPGADSLAHLAATKLGFARHRFHADWRKYGRAAGPIRNQQMLDEGKPDLVIAFHGNIEASKGTKDMVRRARKAGVSVRIIT
jgi:hypothetical protein